MNFACVFPGQGSQHVGMSADLAAHPAALALLQEADQILGFELSSLMANGPKADLDDTLNTQPAVFTVSAALLACLPGVHPSFCAGHSLGEYAALFAAGVFSFSDGLRLVRERGRLMNFAGTAGPGGMAAIIGLDDATVRDICNDAGGVQIANFNSPGQVVVSGTKDGVASVVQAARDRKAKLVSVLDVSIAAHSELMRPIVGDYARAVEATPMRAPSVPVVANLTAMPLATVDEIRAELVGQLTASVRWTQSVEFIAAQSVDTFIEIGSGKVLTGLIKRIVSGAKLINIGDVAAMQKWQSELSEQR